MGRNKRKGDSDDGSDLFVDPDSDAASVISGEEDQEKIEVKETPAQKRRRLAHLYLERIRLEGKQDEYPGSDNAEEGVPFEERLRSEQLREAGKILTIHSEKIYAPNILDRVSFFRTNSKNKHMGTITSVEISIPSKRGWGNGSLCGEESADLPSVFLFTGAKDGSVIKWDFYTKKLLSLYVNNQVGSHRPSREDVLCIASSTDGTLLAVGRRSKIIDVWSIAEDKHIGTLKHHKGAITGLAFRRNTHTLYSCSSDQTVVVWDLDSMSYIDKLFGHEDAVSSIDALAAERCITAGSRDRTIRYWKVPEESQLIFRGRDIVGGSTSTVRLGSLESLAFIDDDTFVSGSDAGSISLWSIKKKKPMFTKDFCHYSGEASNVAGIGIVSLSALHYSDIFASGSNVGSIKIWKISSNKLSFAEILDIPMTGHINNIKIFEVGAPQKEVNLKKLYLAAAVGREHRVGRWTGTIKDAKNVACVFELTRAD